MRRALGALAALSLAHCGEGPTVAPATCAMTALDLGATSPQRLLAIGSNYNTGSVSELPPDASPRALAIAATGDTIARPYGAWTAMLNRSPALGDNVTLYDLRDGTPRPRCQLGLLSADEVSAARGARTWTNAHDVAPLDATHMLVARWNLPSLAVIDLAAGAVQRTVDLSPWKGRAMLPQPDALRRVDDALWITLERLDDVTHPTQPGLVAQLDPTTLAITGTLELPFANPTGAMQPDGGGRWLVAAAGAYDVVGDGGIVAMRREGASPVLDAVVVTEREVDGNIDGFAVVDANRLVLKLAGAQRAGVNAGSLRYVLFDLRDRSHLELLVRSVWSPAPPVVRGGRIFVGDPGTDGGRHEAGVRVFDLDGRPVVTAAIPLGAGMLPYDLALTY